MKIDQEKMLEDLILEMQSTDYQELENLAKDAYNKALEDAVELLQENPEYDVEAILTQLSIK